MVKEKNWLTDHEIQVLFSKADVENMTDEELKSNYEKAIRDYNRYSNKQYKATHEPYIFGQGPFWPAYSKVRMNKAKYDKEHSLEKNHIYKNLNLTREEMKARNKYSIPSPLHDRDYNKVKEDPLNEYFFLKEELDYIVFRLNKDRGLTIKLSGTKPELIKRLKENIGKSERKGVIGGYLGEMDSRYDFTYHYQSNQGK